MSLKREASIALKAHKIFSKAFIILNVLFSPNDSIFLIVILSCQVLKSYYWYRLDLSHLPISSYYFSNCYWQVHQMYFFKIFSKSLFHIKIQLSNNNSSLSNNKKLYPWDRLMLSLSKVWEALEANAWE